MNEVLDAVIVGGGYAGLAAARRLTEEGRSTVVLEARDRVGGRTYTVEEAGATVDLGGQWIGPTQDHIYELAAETGVATFPQWTGGEDVVLEDGHTRRVRGEEDYDADDLAEYSTAVEAIEDAAAGIPLDRPWAAPQARSLDAMTFDTWINEQLQRSGARTMLATTVANIFATEPANMSLLHVLFYIRSGGGWESLTGTEGGAQQDRLVGGLQEPATRLASRLETSFASGGRPERSPMTPLAWLLEAKPARFVPVERSSQFHRRSPGVWFTIPRFPRAAIS